jgi:hypothetical protein
MECTLKLKLILAPTLSTALTPDVIPIDYDIARLGMLPNIGALTATRWTAHQVYGYTCAPDAMRYAEAPALATRLI